MMPSPPVSHIRKEMWRHHIAEQHPEAFWTLLQLTWKGHIWWLAKDPFFVFRGQHDVVIWQDMHRRYVMGKILAKNKTDEWTNIAEEEPQYVILETTPARSAHLYELYYPKLPKTWYCRRPLYALYCSIFIYVCHRNRKDSFLTQERKGTVSRRISLGNWISRLSKGEKILKRIFLNTSMYWL